MAGINRRSFLTGAGTIPLIGTALAAEPYQAKTTGALKSSAKSVVIPTHEFAGNLDERLDFPNNWEINVMNMKGHNDPALSPSQLAASLARPAGTKPLRELAQGKQKVVITFDDLTRGTPTYAITPWVISELKAAGVSDENILFLSSHGTHRPMAVEEIQKKIGKEMSTRYAWMNHNCWSNVKEVGTTSFKNNVRINQTFMDADLKICLSGIRVHSSAGYGGGAKAILPGVAWIDTVAYNHGPIARNTKTTGRVKTFKNEVRLDMVESARLAKVDFTVQVIYNQKLKPTHVFSGDIVDAHHAAVRTAVNYYATPTFKNADIVVVNAYPLNSQAFGTRWWIQQSLKPEGGTGVLIISHPSGVEPVHFLNNRNTGLDGSSYFQQTQRVLNTPQKGNSALIVYSPYLNATIRNTCAKGTLFATKWEEVVKMLQARHKGDVRVAVYPYAGLQHEETELDG